MRYPRRRRIATLLERTVAIALALWALWEGFKRGVLVFFMAAAVDVSPGSGYDRGAATGRAFQFLLLFMVPAIVALGALIWPVWRRTSAAWWKRPWVILAIMGMVYLCEVVFVPEFRLFDLIESLTP